MLNVKVLLKICAVKLVKWTVLNSITVVTRNGVLLDNSHFRSLVTIISRSHLSSRL